MTLQEISQSFDVYMILEQIVDAVDAHNLYGL